MAQAFRSTRVVTPQGMTAAALVVENGRIQEILAWNDLPASESLHDFGHAILLPGLVDSHVHINDPGRTEWEGFTTATQAAASGGVTTLIDMPLNCIPETTDVAALEAKRAAAHGNSYVDWAAWGGVVTGNAAKIPELIQAGVPGFKCFLIHSGIDGFSCVDEPELRAALAHLQGTGLPLLVHAEVPGPVDAASALLKDADWRAYSTFLTSRPDACETEAIAQLIRLAEEFQTPIHIVHLSSATALPMISEARSRGVPFSVETCAHYLVFSAEQIPDGATQFKCAPPIRGDANREALWQALEAGLIQMVTTDHSPCPPQMKRQEEGRFDAAWGGIASLGLALPAMWTALLERGRNDRFAAESVARWMAEVPSRLAGLAGRKGALAAGQDADFAVFDPDAEWTVEPQDLRFRHRISPYLGMQMHGRVLETWLRGEPIFRNGRCADAPRGRALVRS